MNDMRGIEFGGVGCRDDHVLPLQGRRYLIISLTWGFAQSSTPGCHMAGLQPSDFDYGDQIRHPTHHRPIPGRSVEIRARQQLKRLNAKG